METQRNEKLWSIARKRAAFKRHLLTYLAVNVFLWLIWFLNYEDHSFHGMPWPAWCTVGWGIGLFFNYVGAYHSFAHQMEEEEYRKLLKKKNEQQ